MKTSLQLMWLLLFFFCSVLCSRSQAQVSADISIYREDIILKGKMYLHEGAEVVPTVILLHGFPDDGDPLDLGKKLCEAGINVLTFNISGTYLSGGEYNWDNTQKDIKAAFEFINQPENILKYNIDTGNLYLAGYSYGGGMALTYAASNPEVKSVFAVSGNDHGAFMREYDRNPGLKQMIDKIFNDLRGRPEIVRFGPGGTPKEVAEMKFMENNPKYDLIYCAPQLATKNIFLIGGWNDWNVSIENVVLPLYRALLKEGAKDVKITAFQDNHSFKNSRGEIAQVIIEWIKTTTVKNQRDL